IASIALNGGVEPMIVFNLSRFAGVSSAGSEVESFSGLERSSFVVQAFSSVPPCFSGEISPDPRQSAAKRAWTDRHSLVQGAPARPQRFQADAFRVCLRG